jgi:cytochrome o ubiquinol oxidase subunit 1
VPEYNFTTLEPVADRDAWWAAKQAGKPAPRYEDIWIPKNSYVGLFIAGFAFAAGFGLIWHIVWLVVLGLSGVVISVIARSFVDQPDHLLKAATIRRHAEGKAS